jgi:three-Cys-motif partner protein
MSKIIRTVWDIEPHTAKKHEILRRYFQAWLPILGRYNSRLLYIDAFAGPGEYSKGEDGSPLVILKAARDHVLRPSCELVCLFIESDDDRYAHLVGVLERTKPTLPSNIKFRPILGKFNGQLGEIFTQLDEQAERRGPTLAFVDPFGFSQTPFTTIARLLGYPKSEVLVNFMYGEINRFLSNPEFAAHFDALFGTPKWRNIQEIIAPINRFYAIHDLYRDQLRTAARYVHAFLMLNKNNAPDYFLFFGTNSLKGTEAMLETMWKAAPSGEFQFSDFNESKKQIPLFAEAPDYDLLRQILIQKFGRVQIEFEVLCDWVIEYVGFLRPHVRHVIAGMEKDALVGVTNPKPNRRPGTYPEGTDLKFR